MRRELGDPAFPSAWVGWRLDASGLAWRSFNVRKVAADLTNKTERTPLAVTSPIATGVALGFFCRLRRA